MNLKDHVTKMKCKTPFFDKGLEEPLPAPKNRMSGCKEHPKQRKGSFPNRVKKTYVLKT